LHSDVLRFDAQTLEFKGRIGTVFGVRALAVDAARNLLLTGSGLTNMVDVIDLKTKKRVAKHYVGPWLRAIALDQKAGMPTSLPPGAFSGLTTVIVVSEGGSRSGQDGPLLLRATG